MKKKRVMLLLSVAVAAAVSAAVLTGCAKKKAQEPTETGEETEPTEATEAETEETEAAEPTENGGTETGGTAEAKETETEEAGVTQEARDELWALLCSVRNDVQPGTAGSSLKADTVAAKLLQWGARESMSAQDARQIAEEFSTAQSNGFYAEGIEAVDFACKELQGSDAAELLDNIGMTEADKTWGDEPLPLVEAVMEGSGLR